MTIRRRLILSYVAMVLIPLFLILIIGMILTRVFFGGEAGDGNKEGIFPMHGAAFSQVWETINQREQVMNGVKFIAEHDPGLLADNEFLTETDKTLQGLQAGLVVVKNGEVLFASSGVNREGLEDDLSKVGTGGERRHSGWIKEPKVNGRYNAERVDFVFAGQSPGSLYLLSDLNPVFNKMSQFMPTLFLSLLIVIAFTNLLLTFFVSRSIIRPLYTLKHAAERIKEGELDQPLELKRRDEFGEVGEAFEEMRERLKASIRLQLQYEENRKELISNISHDLKTPITGIKACVEGLRDGIADTEEKRDKYIAMIGQKTADMDRLIEELFLFSKLDLKRLPFHFEPVDLHRYLEEWAEELKTDPRYKDVHIDFRSKLAGPLPVLADRDKLKRVLMNIGGNSLQYMNKPEKDLRIELDARPREAIIRIADNGAGIAGEALPHVFERFYRAESARSSTTGGSGLGLAIVRQIVEEHGGNVRADSAVGEGTAISFTLPRRGNLPMGGEQE
ncbi:sensor histidine kinase [Paenibacillus oralis]|uniref:histidine kinase n=1 Tax=Paenibacillus oralis TaxID=2490856 RepID=A0A3P3U5B0_9BACL|nr:HAMP domain-containing sensor histidine kinase [Paenibacillus oralis]RRJ65551.1 sensor histidine kinase [Paenibacillus oralis]